MIGCGISEGEYISLGYYERNDLDCVIQYLRDHKDVSTIGLWGRSMGGFIICKRNYCFNVF